MKINKKIKNIFSFHKKSTPVGKCFTFYGCSFFKTEKCNKSCGNYPPITEQNREKKENNTII